MASISASSGLSTGTERALTGSAAAHRPSKRLGVMSAARARMMAARLAVARAAWIASWSRLRSADPGAESRVGPIASSAQLGPGDVRTTGLSGWISRMFSIRVRAPSASPLAQTS